MFTLYTTGLSANGRNVLAAARELGLEPAIERVDVYRGEGRAPSYLAVNPAGKVPTLVEGAFTLSESNAILTYMSEAHAACALWSREPRGRADIARWMYWEASEWQPALVTVLAGRVAQLLELTAPAPAQAVDWTHARFVRAARHLDAHLEGQAFLVAPWPTLADFSVAGMMTYARAAGFPFAAFPRIAAWYARMEAMASWQATAEGPWAAPA